MVEKLASSEIAQSLELQQAIRIANLFLERPYFDTDGDECVLARQFLRQQEKLAAAERDTRERDAQEADDFLTDNGYGVLAQSVAERIRGKE